MTDMWFIEQFDSFVATNSGGSAVGKSRAAVAESYANAVEAGEIDRHIDASLVAEGARLFDRFVGPVRDRRRQSLAVALEWLADALEGDTLLGIDDPKFLHAYPLGDGTDKSLLYWTTEDYRSATTERYRNAATVTKAAADFDDTTARIVTVMESRGIHRTDMLLTQVSV